MEAQLTKKEAKKIYEENGHRIVDKENKSFVSLSKIDKVYDNKVQAVYNFNLDINKHDFVALVGPSGCGKSTTLRMIAGLEEITSGELYIDGVLSNYLPSKERDIAMVFQSYALYPQLNVYDNIAFGLKIRRFDKDDIEKRVFKAAEILDLGPYLDRKPKELSGGQMQRVALGRAIVRNAKLFLMDEPLSNLDAKLRVQMRSEIVRIHEEVGATTIYVTHDQTEAMTMANKIVVMNKGFVQQTGEPMEIYNHPRNLFVATFIGTPPMNILNASYRDGEITLADDFKFSLAPEFKEYHDRYYKERIEVVKEILSRANDLSEKEIADFKLELLSHSNIQEKKSISYEVKKKSNLINRVKNLFNKKDNENDTLSELRDEFVIYLEEMLTKYESYLANEHEIKVGIRPENIHLALMPKGVASAEFDVKCSLVEILGSEFIVYGNKNDDSLIIKLLDNVKPHTVQSFVLDISRVHLFDSISGESISYNYRKEGELE